MKRRCVILLRACLAGYLHSFFLRRSSHLSSIWWDSCASWRAHSVPVVSMIITRFSLHRVVVRAEATGSCGGIHLLNFGCWCMRMIRTGRVCIRQLRNHSSVSGCVVRIVNVYSCLSDLFVECARSVRVSRGSRQGVTAGRWQLFTGAGIWCLGVELLVLLITLRAGRA